MPGAHNGFFLKMEIAHYCWFSPAKLVPLKKSMKKESALEGVAKWAKSAPARFNSALSPCLSSGPTNLDRRSQSNGRQGFTEGQNRRSKPQSKPLSIIFLMRAS
jgi:hypothetical protein